MRLYASWGCWWGARFGTAGGKPHVRFHDSSMLIEPAEDRGRTLESLQFDGSCRRKRPPRCNPGRVARFEGK
jgi:hypothetical protein